MKLVWSPQAIDDLIALRAYIGPEDRKAAQRMASRIIEAIENLIPQNPRVGRPGRVSGTRELVIPRTSYIAPYRLNKGTIEVLRILHGARRWPDRL